MILIGLGANLPSRFGGPQETLEHALSEMSARGLRVIVRSSWFKTAPVPISDQPWYVNGVAAVDTDLNAVSVLAVLHLIEAEFGRVRGERNAARAVDLDLLAYHDHVIGSGMTVPHPRMHERAFVLMPLAEIAPDWIHPSLDRRAAELIAALPQDQLAERIG